MRHLGALRAAADLGPVLDLACGGGRNGLYLTQQDLPVVFADRRKEALAQVADEPGGDKALRLWQVDLETGEDNPLAGAQFGAILVFRYLHRPLMPAIAEAIAPGGVVMYETFTVDQPRHGRPTNPDFLLRHGELPGYFPDWEQLHHFEGEAVNPASENVQAFAQLIARKPGA